MGSSLKKQSKLTHKSKFSPDCLVVVVSVVTGVSDDVWREHCNVEMTAGVFPGQHLKQGSGLPIGLGQVEDESPENLSV